MKDSSQGYFPEPQGLLKIVRRIDGFPGNTELIMREDNGIVMVKKALERYQKKAVKD